MIKTLYTSIAGIMKEDRKIQSIASNLSNIDNAGFKKQITIANEYQNEINKSPASLTHLRYDLSQGGIKQTNGMLDFGLYGQGFFRVEQPDGTIGYHRGGNFAVNQMGVLTTTEGHPVLALNQTTNQHEYVYVGDSNLLVAEDGSFTLNDNYNFDLVTFDDLQLLERVNDNLFRTDQVPVNVTGTKILQGFTETSNVDITEEYTDLIMSNRTLQTSYSAFQSVDELVEKSINDVGKV